MTWAAVKDAAAKPLTKESSLNLLNSADLIVIKARLSHKLTFMTGLLVGLLLLRHQLLVDASYWLRTRLILGYELDPDKGCIIMKKKDGSLDYCREPADCHMCDNLTSIDTIDVKDMSERLFVEKYAYSGRPLLVKNAVEHSEALHVFSFDFFKEMYEDLDSPVLWNEDPDCQFFAWDFKEFHNLNQVFQMMPDRAAMMGNYSPWYIGWANCDELAVDYLRQFYDRPSFLPEDSESGRRDWIFIGTPGFGAPFHIDNVKYPSWQAQISGNKEWSLRPPPECWWSCPKQMNVVLSPGDVIVVNTNWWSHATRVLNGLSITITNEYL